MNPNDRIFFILMYQWFTTLSVPDRPVGGSSSRVGPAMRTKAQYISVRKYITIGVRQITA